MPTLSVIGAKGSDLVIELGHLNFLSSANSSGKSTAICGLEFLVLGYSLSVSDGRDEAATALILRDREMEARLDNLEGNRWCCRKFFRKAKGGYGSTVQCSWLPEGASQRDHAAALLALFGETEESVRELLNAKALIRLTPNKRAARIASLISSVEDPEATSDTVTAYAVQTLAGIADERMPNDFSDVCRMVPGFDKSGAHTGQYAVLKAVNAEVSKVIAGEGGIAAAIDHANKCKNDEKAKVRTRAAAADEFRPQVAALASYTPEEMAKLNADRGRLEREVGAQKQRLAERKRRADAVASATSARQAALTQAAAAQEQRKAFEAQAATLDQKRARLAEVETALEGIIAPEQPDTKEADAIDATADALDRRARAIEIPVAIDISRNEQGVVDLRAKIKAAKSDPWAEVADHAAWIESTSKGSSEKVVELRKRAGRLTELATANGATGTENLQAQLAAAETELARVAKLKEKVDNQRSELGAERTRLETQASEKRREAKAMRDQGRAIFGLQSCLQSLLVSCLRDERTGLTAAIAALVERDSRTAEWVRTTAVELQAAEQRMVDLGEVEAATPEEDLAAELKRVEADIDTAQRAATLRSELQRMLAEIEAAQTAHIVWSAVHDALVRTRNEQVAEQGAPLRDAMRRYFDAAQITDADGVEICPEALIRAGKNECFIGWRPTRGKLAGKEIAVEALCGSEMVHFTTALVGAMQTMHNAALRVLLVEAAEVYGRNVESLLAGITAISDALTCAIVARPEAPTELPDGWNLISPTGTKQSEAA